MEDKIIISDFGNASVNGDYNFAGYANGLAYYKKDNNHFLIYKSEFMPWSLDPSYYLIKITQTLDNSTTIETPYYRLPGTNPEGLSNNWISLRPETSGENQTGSSELDLASSSSSSSSSSS